MDISDSSHRQRAVRSERRVEREKPSAGGMAREIGKVCVVPAHRHTSLPIEAAVHGWNTGL